MNVCTIAFVLVSYVSRSDKYRFSTSDEMSGCGRKHRAKHLTQQYLDVSAWQGLKEGEVFGVCVDSPQSQHVRVLLLLPRNDSAVTLSDVRPAEAPSGPNGARCTASNSTRNVGIDGLNTGVRDGGASLASHSDLVASLVRLPGKFRKVIWLRVKDVVVVAKDTIVVKPSPEQLVNFCKDPRNTEWADRIKVAQYIAETQRSSMERLPLHIRLTTTTTSQLPAQESAQTLSRTDAKTIVSADTPSSSPTLAGHAGAVEGSCMTTIAKPNANVIADGEEDNITQHPCDCEAVHDALDECSDDRETSLNDIVNPNRQNIRHRVQFFKGADEDDDDDEETE